MSHSLDHFTSLVLIVGLSGAGKSTASKAYSDFGYFSIDNLPVALVPHFLELSKTNPEKFSKSCILLDVESTSKREELLELLSTLDQSKANFKLVFLDCANNTLVRRYSETRRPHPSFDIERDKTLSDTITRERERLEPLKEFAHYRLDSSELNVHDLKRTLKETVDSIITTKETDIRINFLSFGFKHGIPLDCDLVVDVRFLKNPYFIKHLKEKTGLDKEVRDYVLKEEGAVDFISHYKELLDFLIPKYSYEGKSYLNIGIGCTGGKHRSVTLAITLAEALTNSPKSNNLDGKERYVSVSHRDVKK